ncbi:polymerase delta-interacting protein 3-like [Strongylocentrotus purpuratus]|uniref:RRM domain-containing protein n=1 Tax=Strongylocentrotus purpuratus TaxID=7668 RepID=A0A7M7PTC8_STRPU|nr:polymerase delta-interacting protein 3-like [Strongylocentrotus purpuratus]
MDQSLDDIIRNRKTSKPSNFQNRLGRGRGRGGPGGNRGGRAPPGNPRGQNKGRGKGNWQKQQFPLEKPVIVDARQKLIQKAHQGDARDRLAKKARQTDARLKLTSKKRSADGQVVRQPRSGEQLAPPPPDAAQTRPLARTVPNLGSTFTVRNPARVQNKTQITIRNPPQQESTSSLSLATSHHGTSPRQSNNPLLAGSSTLRVTKAVPQPQKLQRPAVDYPHFNDDLISVPQPNPPKVQRRMPESVMAQNRAWATGFSARLHTHAQPPGTRLIISNLQISVTVDDIKELFGAIGELTKTRMVKPGLAEVVYVSRTDAIQAISTYHNRELDGKPMLCKLDTSTVPEASGNRTMPNSLSDRFKGMRPENNPKLPFESMPKGTVPSGIDPGVVQKALFKKGATPSAQKPVVFTVKI